MYRHTILESNPKVFCQWLATGLWFSPGTPVSSTNKTGDHNITEIMLKVALNTVNQTKRFMRGLIASPIPNHDQAEKYDCHYKSDKTL